VLNEKDKYYLKAFGQNVKKLRTSKNLTQQHLADILDVEISQISRVERGTMNTSIINVKKIAEGLNVEIADLFKFQ
jgi:transcriptional regulator with XRE-family HTH domain